MQPRPSPTFGRRPAPSLTAAPAAHLAALSPEAEQFRAALASAPRGAEDGFTAWTRSRGAGRVAAWLATFALLSPGVVCFALKAPTGVSFAVEAFGIAANWWLRRRRRAHLAAIRDWRPQAD